MEIIAAYGTIMVILAIIFGLYMTWGRRSERSRQRHGDIGRGRGYHHEAGDRHCRYL